MTLAAGDHLGPLRLTITAGRMRDLSVILGDTNPIHLDVEVVKELGMGDRVINQGPGNIAYLLSMLEGITPGAVIDDVDVRFMANVFDGEVVEAAGVVDEVDDNLLRCTVWLDTTDSRPDAPAEATRRALEGTAIIRLPRPLES